MNGFVHLHLHTQYSLLDGAADIARVTDLASELGMKSVAITDHGCMYGVIEFYESAISKGLKPIIGCEVYTAGRSRFDKDAADKRYGHLVLLCKNETGYQNLMSLVTLSNTEGFYYKPRVDMELLRSHSDGLVALSGCLRGDVADTFLRYGYDAAKKKAEEFEEIFGKDNFFLEIQNHGIPEEKLVREALLKMSSEMGIDLVATNDVHYVTKDEALLQDVLTCIQTGKKLSDTDRMKMEEEEYYFKTEAEMKALFKDFPGAVENTAKIADMCNLTIDTDSVHLPSISIDSPLSHHDYLKALCVEGIVKKYGELTPNLEKRLSYELDTINHMGYTDYFLIVGDFIDYSKRNGIAVGPGRGSAAGSLVAYSLGITEVDPIANDLLFERFLNPERVTMPDIDIDFCYRRRDEVRSYVARKYGEGRVAQIVTFGTLAARAAIKDVGRVMGIDYQITNRISNAVPRVLNIKLKDALKESRELSAMYNEDPVVKNLLDIAMKLEGYPRNCSTHAAGVVIGDDELTKYVPLQNCETGLLTQYPMAALEKIGLLKMDFLGLRNLTVIDDCLELIRDIHGTKLSVDSIPTDDAKTFDMIQRGDTDAVFQLENPGLQTFLRKFRPKSVDDITITTSIYRPGPMEQIPLFLENFKNPENIRYKHPLLEDILKPTFGVVIYQEQVMQIVRKIAGYSMGRADLVRRVMAKKKYAEMMKEREIFVNGLVENGKIVIDGALRRGVDEKTANDIFDSLVDFANYAFNKSHGACYALLAYRIAYLKSNYPTCYLAAVLKNYAGYVNKAVKYISSFAKYGIKVLPPDVNRSFSHFTPEDNNVRFGLCWLKNVGDRFPLAISLEREKNGMFHSFEDFVKRMSGYEINKRSVEVMIKCGCFDSIYPNRKVLMYNMETLIDKHTEISRTSGIGQLDWFSQLEGDDAVTPLYHEDCRDFEPEEKMAFEYELSGMYFSGHPLDRWKLKINALSSRSVAEIAESELFDGEKVELCGRISSLASRRTKSGKLLYSMTFSDFSGECPLVAFESTMSKNSDIIFDGAVVMINATVSFRDEEKGAELALNYAAPLSAVRISPEKSLYIKVSDNEGFEKLKPVFKKYPGDNGLCIYFENTKSWVKADSSRRVAITDSLLEELGEFVDEKNIKIK